VEWVAFLCLGFCREALGRELFRVGWGCSIVRQLVGFVMCVWDEECGSHGNVGCCVDCRGEGRGGDLGDWVELRGR
jgi:hypothetical protein